MKVLENGGYRVASITWPEGLPITLKTSGLNASYKDPVVRTEMDAGPVKARLRYTAAPKTVSGAITITEQQRDILEYFYTVVTGFGANRFNMTDPQTLEVAEFRFTGPPNENGNDGGLWEISISLERL
jgi:hypothetical protein